MRYRSCRGWSHPHRLCRRCHIEYLILLSVRCDLQRICRGVAVDLVHILFQAQLVFCHVNSVGNAHIAEGIAAAVLAGLFFLAVRIAHHKAVLCGVFSDPAVLRIFLRIIIVRSAVSEVDLQIKASAAVIVGCAAFEVGAAVCIPCILVCLVPIAAEYLHSAQSGLLFKCRHHLVQMLDRLSVQLDFHIADAVGTVPVLIDTFEFRVASGEIVGVIFVNKDQIALVHALGSQCDLLAVGQMLSSACVVFVVSVATSGASVWVSFSLFSTFSAEVVAVATGVLPDSSGDFRRWQLWKHSAPISRTISRNGTPTAAMRSSRSLRFLAWLPPFLAAFLSTSGFGDGSFA